MAALVLKRENRFIILLFWFFRRVVCVIACTRRPTFSSPLRREHLLDGQGHVADEITLTNDITKGKSGGKIPLNETLRQSLISLWQASGREAARGAVIRSERGAAMRTQSIVNLLFKHYRKCEIQGASSHSGRRTFITNLARKISLAGGSMRDVQALS
jgi:integrase